MATPSTRAETSGNPRGESPRQARLHADGEPAEPSDVLWEHMDESRAEDRRRKATTSPPLFLRV